MDKYELDFRSFEDILYEVLNIKNPRNITSLKFQIRKTFEELKKDLEKNYHDFIGTDKYELQKQKIDEEAKKFLAERDLEKVLKYCIAIRAMAIQSVEEKIKQEDSEEIREEKLNKIKSAYNLVSISENVPSLLEYMDNRINILEHVDYEKAKIKFNKSKPKSTEKNLLKPYNRLDIRFYSNPPMFSGNHRKVLEDSGIYVYRFGGVRHSILPDSENNYTQKYNTKELVGVIKKDEFGNVKKYSVLMDELSYRIPPEFYRDIVFSDMVLRNSEENCGYIGEIRKDNDDSEYGYKLCYDGLNMDDFLRALYFSDRPELVKTASNFSKINNYAEARNVVTNKLDNALNRFFADDEKIMGDD